MFKRIVTSATCLLLLVAAIVTASCIAQEKGQSTGSNVVSSKPSVYPGDTKITSSALMIPFTLDDMIKITDTAVVGKVVEILPAKQIDFGGLPTPFSNAIYTDVVIEPEQYLYGEPQAKRIIVRVNEGRIGNTVMRGEDEAEFILGEKCAVFLSRPSYQHVVPEGFDDANYYVLWALRGGKYKIENGTLIDLKNNKITLSDVEQKVALIRGMTK